MKKKVIIVQRRLTHYRVALFQMLKTELRDRGIELQLLVGVGNPRETRKEDSGELSWATQVPTRYFLNNKLCWQPTHQYLIEADLVIVTQENALIANHFLVLWPKRQFILAFWGHGANLQSHHPNGLKEKFKRWTTNRVDWWFAYSEKSLDLVVGSGFPANRVTVVNNSIDTTELQQHFESIADSETKSLRASLCLGNGPVGVFLGSLYTEKRLGFLFDAAERIRSRVDNFSLLIIGDGPERARVQAFCVGHQWAHWAGALRGREKVLHIATGQVMLNPGLVGLSMLDSFVCRVPMLTTDCKIHSPEIAYLENKYNGIMTVNDIDEYSNTTIELLKNTELLNSLQKGCEASAELFTLEKMVNRFADGISNALMYQLGGGNGAE